MVFGAKEAAEEERAGGGVEAAELTEEGSVAGRASNQFTCLLFS